MTGHILCIAIMMFAASTSLANPLLADMITAARSGDAAAIESFLAQGASANVTTKKGVSILTYAALGGHLNVVKLLLDKGADPNHVAPFGESPLILAASRGHREVFDCLVAHGARADYGAPWTATVLVQAGKGGDTNIIRYLLASVRHTENDLRYALQNAELEGRIDAIDQLTRALQTAVEAAKTSTTPRTEKLFRAVAAGDYDQVLELFAQGEKANATNQFGTTLLGVACVAGRAEVVKLLLEKGAPMESVRRQAIQNAVRSGRYDAMEYLLTHGATAPIKTEILIAAANNGIERLVRLCLAAGTEVNAKGEEGAPPLAYAENQCHDAIVTILKDAGARPDPAAMAKLPSPLIDAVRRNDLDRLRFLLDRGMNPNKQAPGDYGPLRWALAWAGIFTGPTNNGLAAAKLLLEHGADPKLNPDRMGITLISLAAGFDDPELVRRLIEKGESPDGRDAMGNTALMIAAGKGRLKSVQALLDKGADANARNSQGDTALTKAAANGFDPVIELLKKAGARRDERTP